MSFQAALDMIPFITGITFLCCISIFPVLAIFQRTRAFAGGCFIASSFIFGFTSAAITYVSWGIFALLAGLLVIGIGVLPMALIIICWHGDWSWLISILLMITFTYGFRLIGLWVQTKIIR